VDLWLISTNDLHHVANDSTTSVSDDTPDFGDRIIDQSSVTFVHILHADTNRGSLERNREISRKQYPWLSFP
jgi:hypothetical protein